MIFEEFLNIIWFLCTKEIQNDAEQPETQHLNGAEDRTNTECVENGGGNVQDNDTNVEQPEDIGEIDPGVLDGRFTIYIKNCIGNNLHQLAGISVWPSLKPSQQVNVTTLLVAIVIAACAACLLYLDFETTDKCLSLMQFHGTIPNRVHRWELIGETFQAILVNLWFVVTMMLLYGGELVQELKHKLISVGLAVASVQIIVKAYLIVFNAYNISCNEVFLLGFCYSSYLVGKAVNDETITKKLKWKTAFSIGAHFLLMFIIALCHRFGVIPLFNRENDLTSKALIALISPILAFVATSISQYLVLACSTPWLVYRDRMYVLVYFNQLLPLALFRVMQADFDDWGLFVALSLVYCITIFISQATRDHRKSAWKKLMEYLGNAWPRLRNRPGALFEKPESEKLQIDLQIQHILYHYASIILSQIYITLYRYSTFDIPLQEEMSRMFARIGVCLAIELVLNILSVSVQIRFCGSKIRKVWFDCCGRHVVANAVVVVITICYFSQVLLSVLQVPMGSTLEGYRVRNCSLPFTYE